MKKVRRIEITIETDRVLSISRRLVTWCAACAEPVAMVRVDEAAALADVSSHAIYWQMEAGRIHFTETPEGLPLTKTQNFSDPSGFCGSELMAT